MKTPPTGPEIEKSALLIVDMQNDFLHRDGSIGHIARGHPEAKIDIPFLTGTIPHVKKLAVAFRAAGRPVIYLAHVLKPDYSDATFPYWRLGMEPGGGNRTHCVESTWGAQIVDELQPQDGEHLIAAPLNIGRFSDRDRRDHGTMSYCAPFGLLEQDAGVPLRYITASIVSKETPLAMRSNGPCGAA